jgi:hypothetical protein
MSDIIETKELDTFQHSWDVMGVFLTYLMLSLMPFTPVIIVIRSVPTIAREVGGGQVYIYRLLTLFDIMGYR